jgi:hypothetical protein
VSDLHNFPLPSVSDVNFPQSQPLSLSHTRTLSLTLTLFLPNPFSLSLPRHLLPLSSDVLFLLSMLFISSLFFPSFTNLIISHPFLSFSLPSCILYHLITSTMRLYLTPSPHIFTHISTSHFRLKLPCTSTSHYLNLLPHTSTYVIHPNRR